MEDSTRLFLGYLSVILAIIFVVGLIVAYFKMSMAIWRRIVLGDVGAAFGRGFATWKSQTSSSTSSNSNSKTKKAEVNTMVLDDSTFACFDEAGSGRNRYTIAPIAPSEGVFIADDDDDIVDDEIETSVTVV